MCRLAGYVGPGATLASLVYDAPHGLERQAYRPREMIAGTVSVDGTGVAWWPDESAEPLRYVTERPPWSDANLPSLAARLAGRVQLAAVRSATPGLPFGPDTVLPFVRGDLAGALNGYIEGFREGVAARLLDALPAGLRGAIVTVTDASLLFLAAAAHRADRPDEGLEGAAAAAVTLGRRVAREEGVKASLTLMLADTTGVVAVRAAETVPSNSLYTAAGNARWPGGSLVASEPLDDDPSWTAVPDEHVVTLGRDGVALRAL